MGYMENEFNNKKYEYSDFVMFDTVDCPQCGNECTVGFLFALYSGAQTVFCDGIRHIMKNMNEYKVSVMASVPAIYERIYKD